MADGFPMPLHRLSSAQHSIGGMSRQVTLYLPGARNSDGTAQPPSPSLVIWADVRALRGDERDRPQVIAQEVEHVISTTYQTGIDENMLAGYENRMFEIKFIEDQDERHVFLDLFCAEVGQNAGQTAGAS